MVVTARSVDDISPSSSPESQSIASGKVERSMDDIADGGSADGSAADPYELAPPPLPYNLREHKWTISIFWFLILTECTLIPIVFYFTISRLTDLRPGAMFAIITAMFGFISGGEYGLRALRLIAKSDKYRPLHGAGRWSFDTVHLVLGPPYFVMTAMMIGFSIPDPPIIRGLAITMPVGIAMVTSYMIWTGIAWHNQWKLRWYRMSSHVVGDVCPPLTFTIMEDICGCDGGGGKTYREAAMKRFHESPRFRTMLVQMLWAWATTGLVIGIVLAVVAWKVHAEVGYALGWGVPSVWGAVGAWLTILWGKRSIRIEHETWAVERRARKGDA